MKASVVMPQLGLTMTEGTVSKWLKEPGDSVAKGEILLVVSTEKVDMDVESMSEGTLADIVVGAGLTVPVGTVLAYIEKPGEEMGALESGTEIAPFNPSIPPSRDPNGIQESGNDRPRVFVLQKQPSAVSPRARRLARELGVDISTLSGSGAGGRVVEADVLRRSEEAQGSETSSRERRRQVIAGKMAESIQTIPHFTVVLEVNAQELTALYADLKKRVGQFAGLKISLTDLVLKCTAIALTEVPGMNVVWENGKSRFLETVDVGLAVATEQGVVAPVLHGIDKLDIKRIARRRSELIEKARQERLSLKDLEGGVGTLSNLGMYQIDQFQAIISPGQSFILALGQVRNRPWVDESGLTARPTMILSLSVDHRVADGALAAQFLRKVAETIEHPYRTLCTPERKALGGEDKIR